MIKEHQVSRRELLAQGMGAVGLCAASCSLGLGQKKASAANDAAATKRPLRAKGVDDFLKSLDPSGHGIPADARYKPGSGGQLIAFVPSLDLVVTRQTGSSGQWEYADYLRRACAAVLPKAN